MSDRESEMRNTNDRRQDERRQDKRRQKDRRKQQRHPIGTYIWRSHLLLVRSKIPLLRRKMPGSKQQPRTMTI